MAMHSVIEINHDLADKFMDDPDFGRRLYGVLAKMWGSEKCQGVLKEYGIKLIDQHHSSVKHEWKGEGK